MGTRFLAPKARRVLCRAVVTAGGRVEGAFAMVIGTDIKALAPLGAGVLIEPVLRALRGCGISEIAIVGSPVVAAHLHGGGLTIIDAAEDGATNVLRALDAWPDGDLVFATSDLPYVSARALAPFLEASRAFDLTMPLAEAAAYVAAYPGAPDHVTQLGGDRVVNGSVFFISERARAPVRAIAARFFDARKSRVAMARLLGPRMLFQFVVRRLQIADVERRARTALGVEARAIRNAAPELCYDIDTLADYRYACRH